MIEVSMNTDKKWLSRHWSIIYAACILIFLGLVLITYYFINVYACAAVSFGIPAIVLAYGLFGKNGQIDSL
jgi:hypothetical protein